MGREIERKFLVRGEPWREGGRGTSLRQGYLSVDPERVVRVRVAGAAGVLTVKGRGSGAVRPEFEFSIPHADAADMLDTLCLRPLIEKTRYRLPFGGRTWEIDVFEGENAGLVIAEVELASEAEEVDIPSWAGEEVTGQSRYENASLVSRPYRAWKR